MVSRQPFTSDAFWHNGLAYDNGLATLVVTADLSKSHRFDQFP